MWVASEGCGIVSFKKMAAGCNYYWRIVGTTLAFSSFGIGGLILSLVFIPPAQLWPGTEQQKVRRVRCIISKTFALFVGLMDVLGVMKTQSKNDALLKDVAGCLVVSNHPSLVDVVVIISLIKNANCVIKQGVVRNPFMRWVVKAAGYIVNTDSESLLDECKRSLDKGDCLVIFPEGTRTTPGQPLAFKRGAANIAVRAAAPFMTARINVTPTTLIKGQWWFQVPDKKVLFSIEWLAKYPSSDFYEMDAGPALAARQCTKNLQQYFQQELARNE